MDSNQPPPASAAAIAALSICESLIISLIEKGLLDPAEFEEIFEVARDAHLNAAPTDFSLNDHRRAANILRRIQVSANAVRGSSYL
ncbi:MAG: hypothetical protein RIC87_23485 [Kiloniellales bacterium]